MGNLRGYHASQHKPRVGFETIQIGKYAAKIVESEMMPNSSNTGKYLKLTFEITEGEFQGRKVWAQLNLIHPNAQTVDIAKSELSAICHAVGVMDPEDSRDLHDKPMLITVGMEKRSDTGELKNVIRGYTKLDDGLDGEEAPWDAAEEAPAEAEAAPAKRNRQGAGGKGKSANVPI